MALEPGGILAHYRLLEKIGEGGMASVWKALDTKLDRQVALKVLPDGFAQNTEALERFQREAKMLASLHHPHIVTIHAVEEANGIHFLTMELVRGRTLSALVPESGLAPKPFFELTIPLVNAVASAHERGIVHRDLKPDNVMVGADGQPKVLDFGLAKASTIEPGHSLTREGQVIGTVWYMSPEQAVGDTADSRSDVFSLGVMLYEMAAGRRPFRGDSGVAIITAILKDTPPPATERNGSLPPGLDGVIAHCLEKEPERRFESAVDLRDELQELKSALETGEPVPIRRVPTAERPAPPRRRWVPAAGGAAALVLIAGYLLSGSRDSNVPAERSVVVVLPLQNLGGPEDDYFASGITWEITDRLAVAGGLAVISRNSAARYAETKKTIQQIGADGVDYVLTGTIRWVRELDANRIRISTQLTRVSDDAPVWSKTYERVLDDVFALQSDIARTVVDRLGITLRPREQKALESKSTENLEAYQAYLNGIEHDRMTAANYIPDLKIAVEMFEEAVRLDPDFLLARMKLVRVCAMLHHQTDETGDWRAKAKEALDHAQILAPESLPVRLAEAHYQYGVRNYERALEIAESIAEESPNEIEAVELIAYASRRMGQFDRCLTEFEKLLRLDPQNVGGYSALGGLYRALRRFEEAQSVLDRALAVTPNSSMLYQDVLDNLVAWKGDVKGVRALLESAPEGANSPDAFILLEWYDRRFERALGLIDALPRDTGLADFDIPMYYARTYHYMKQPQQARQAVGTALATAKTLVERQPQSGWGHAWLGIAYALAGRKEEAIHEGKKGVRLLSDDGSRGAVAQDKLARIYAWVGEEDKAIALLEHLLSVHYEFAITVPLLRLDPAWDSLRDHPRFQKLLEPDP